MPTAPAPTPARDPLHGLTPRRVAWLRPLVRAALWLCFGYRVRGREHLPRTGPFILAPNHQSYLDPVLADAAQDAPLYFMAWAALFRVPLLGGVMRWFAAFPVTTDREDPRAVRLALAVLRSGGRLMVFPEGERTPDGRLLPLKPGVARLAVQTGAPIIPVRIRGAHRAWPKGRLPRPIRGLSVTFAPPLHPNPALPKEAAQAALLAQVREALEQE